MANLQTLARRLGRAISTYSSSIKLYWYIEEKPVKVNKWNGQEYLVEEAQYQADRSLQVKKLGFLVLLTIIGGATGLYARFTPFEKAKLLTGIGAIAYLVLLGYFTLWTSFLTVQTCFRGTTTTNATKSTTVTTTSGRKSLWLKSELHLPEAVYELQVLDPRTGKLTKINKKWQIDEWIYEDGVICGEYFCQAMREFLSSDILKSYLKSD